MHQFGQNALLGFFEADIRVNRKPLSEYDNNDSSKVPEERKIIKYVEAPTGAVFSICLDSAWLPDDFGGYQIQSLDRW
ncbi:MAG: hypothetical protein Q9201_001936 [Fulgogasparrea decipioides]